MERCPIRLAAPRVLASGAVKEAPMLEIRSLSKRYSGIAVVDDVSFSARPGEVTAYLGPN